MLAVSVQKKQSPRISKKPFSWPHPKQGFPVAPSSLASSGLFYEAIVATPGRNINGVRCVACCAELAGWNDGDDVVKRHLAASAALEKPCLLAILSRETAQTSSTSWQNPHSEAMVEVRRASFLRPRKFDRKKGAKATSEQVRERSFPPLLTAPGIQDLCLAGYITQTCPHTKESEQARDEGAEVLGKAAERLRQLSA